MQIELFKFLLNPTGPRQTDETLNVAGRRVPMVLVRSRRARRYLLRLRHDGSARVTIPRGGSATEARRFAQRNEVWLERQLLRLATQPSRPKEWSVGTEIFFRGDLIKIVAVSNGEPALIALAGETIKVTDVTGNLRPAMEKFMWRLAGKELPPRVLELAAIHQAPVRRVTVRNQRSRWGSCSRRGTISLNWRLIQAPLFVRDYLILHELAHLKEMNHSSRFWRQVERICPGYESAEKWLKEHNDLLR